MKTRLFISSITLALLGTSCQNNQKDISDITEIRSNDSIKSIALDSVPAFQFQAEQFADLRILRYQVPGFEELSLQQKTLIYYLYEATLCGRDILWDQNYKYNLTIRKTIETIYESYNGDRTSEDFKKFEVYAKRVWFSNGIHHHYSSDKIIPEFQKSFFSTLISKSSSAGFPINSGENLAQFEQRISEIIFNPTLAPKKVNLDPKFDLVASSAVNYYEGLTQKEAEDFYKDANKLNGKTPVMTGLNSKLIKENGKLVEKTWKLGGMYNSAIERIIFWLEKAVPFTENETQKDALVKLITFYKTGSLKDFDTYSIAWAKDNQSAVDVVNGFIETYNDPIGYKGTYEAIVSVKDMEASKRITTIGNNAQWFEDNSPILPEHKKENVTGISAKVINVVVESGDAAPATPIGINLPNNEWIREQHGSKSVNLGNIVEAYDRASGAGVVNEFYLGTEVQNRVKNYASLADKLHTDMHEVIGHASGKIEDGIDQPSTTLKNYASTLEEARADLVALYYLYDQKLVDLSVMPSLDYGKASYDEYITKGLIVQLSRLKLGNNLEEAHMRNRQLVAAWVYEKGKKDNVIEKVVNENKTYFVVKDYNKLRSLFGDLLREIQRIKSKGDYKAGRDLVENYGVKVDPVLHKEVLARFEKLNIAPYAGFIQPRLVPVMEGNKIIDVKIEYPSDFTQQMIYFGKNYALLPVVN